MSGRIDLRLGIAQPDIELDDLRTVAVSIRPTYRKPRNGWPSAAIPRNHRLDDLPHDAGARAPRRRADSARTRPCRPYSARGHRRRSACDPAPSRSGRPARRRDTTKNDTSGPVRHSSMTSRSPAAPNLRSAIAAIDGRFGGRPVVGDDDALAGRQAVGLEDDRPAEFAGADDAQAPRSSDSQVRKRAVGTPWRAMNAFANALLDSSRAAAAVGPKIGRPAAHEPIDDAEAQGSSGPTTVKSMLLALQRARAGAAGRRDRRERFAPGAQYRDFPARRRARRRRVRRPGGRRGRARGRRHRSPELALSK